MLHSNVRSGAAIPGDDCVKYVGGLLRNYKGKINKNVIIEVVVQPLVFIKTKNVAALPEWELKGLEDILDVVVLLEANKEDKDK